MHADNDLTAPHLRVPKGGLFDAIITDPPYGEYLSTHHSLLTTHNH